MLPWLIVGVVLAASVMLILRGFIGANPQQMAALLRWTVLGIGVGLGVLLLATGRITLAAADLVAIALMLMQSSAVWSRMKSAWGPKPGQSSAVETGWLKMELDHDSGSLDGTIKQGRFSGRRLGALTQEELVELLHACASDDPPSVALIETFLDRVYPDWRMAGQQQDGTASAEGGFASSMTPTEARRILGVDENAGEDAIREAHRRLMLKNHPDQGGSTYLAAKINQAKDVLLKKRR